MCKTWGSIWIGILMESRIRIGIKTMLIRSVTYKKLYKSKNKSIHHHICSFFNELYQILLLKSSRKELGGRPVVIKRA
jgi:hypothetical protein